MAKRSLGRGIDALLAGNEVAVQAAGVSTVPTDSLRVGGHQPRRRFDDKALAELAHSIQQKGVLQPLLVEPADSGSYLIVAGERRYRAARKAGLREVPVIIRRFSDLEKTEIALIENLQREDLTAVEEAQGYRNLIDQGGLTQEEVAKRVGKDRSTVANSLRLLKLEPEYLEALEGQRISAGHARALLSLVNPADQQLLFRKMLQEGLSVREAEHAAQRMSQGKRGTGKNAPGARRPSPAAVSALEQRLIERLGTKVVIRGDERKGRIEISYYSMDDLERVLGLIDAQG
jgi:ParB family chromosome partitioning protein